MSKERPATPEKIHPNVILNDAISYFVLDAYEKGILDQKNNQKITTGVTSHMANSYFLEKFNEFPKKEEFEKNKDLVLSLGESALQALSSGVGIKDEARNKFDPRLIAYAPQALLIYSYLPLLTNLYEVAKGEKEYGYGKELDRLQPHNSLAAGEMMKSASRKIASEIGKMANESGLNNVALFELGCGNASFSVAVLKEFEQRGLALPKVLATDLNPKTQITAINLFKEKGYLDNLSVMELDMGSSAGLLKASEALKDKTVILHIGYILHENRDLAIRTLKGLTEVFGNKNVIFAFSEYYKQWDITDEVPLWFQTIHAMTQDLFSKSEFDKFVTSFGLTKTNEVVHNARKDNGNITNSTTFWKK